MADLKGARVRAAQPGQRSVFITDFDCTLTSFHFYFYVNQFEQTFERSEPPAPELKNMLNVILQERREKKSQFAKYITELGMDMFPKSTMAFEHYRNAAPDIQTPVLLFGGEKRKKQVELFFRDLTARNIPIVISTHGVGTQIWALFRWIGWDKIWSDARVLVDYGDYEGLTRLPFLDWPSMVIHSRAQTGVTKPQLLDYFEGRTDLARMVYVDDTHKEHLEFVQKRWKVQPIRCPETNFQDLSNNYSFMCDLEQNGAGLTAEHMLRILLKFSLYRPEKKKSGASAKRDSSSRPEWGRF